MLYEGIYPGDPPRANTAYFAVYFALEHANSCPSWASAAFCAA